MLWALRQDACSVLVALTRTLARQAGKKRPLEEDETSDFFSWFDKENEDEEFIGQPMKEIWEEPVKVRSPLSSRVPARLCPPALTARSHLAPRASRLSRSLTHRLDAPSALRKGSASLLAR